MTDPEEFDFDWNARHNAKPLEERDPIRDAIGGAAVDVVADIDSKDKHTFMAELAAKVSVSEFEREQALLELAPSIVNALDMTLNDPTNHTVRVVADTILKRARALLP
jgi:hypothetical protein